MERVEGGGLMARERLALGTAGRISCRRIGDSTSWRARARYRDALGAYHEASATGPTKGRAEANLKDRLDRLTESARRPGITTVGELCQTWLDRVVEESEQFWSRPDAARRQGALPPRPQSLVHSRRAVGYVCARPGGIGDLTLSEVTTLGLETWLLEHAKVSRGRAAEIRVALRGAFKSAVRLGILATNPMAGVDAIRRNDPRPIALTADELRTIRTVLAESRDLTVTRATAARLDALIVVLLGTGMRVGEAAAMRWSDLVLTGSDPTVTVSGTQVEITGTGLVRQDVPKTESSNRIILLPPAVVDALTELRPERWAPAGWVFSTRNDTAWNTGNAAKILDRVVEVSAGKLEPHRVSFHKLRSTAATAIAAAYGTEIAGQVLGHKPTGVTRMHYIAKPEVAPDVRDTLQRLVESSSGHMERPRPNKIGRNLKAV